MPPPVDAADYFAIQNLIHRYAERLDRGDFAGVAELFAEADVYLPARAEPYRSDRAGLLALWRSMVRIDPATGTPLTRHLMSNLIVEAEGPESARAQTYGTVLQAAPELPLQPIITVTYHDRFARRGGVWRYTERRLEMGLIGDLSQHLLQGVGARKP
ncbi:MAG TPA: nuclear transport factor 2 family protein [Nevskia sp.]|nr:nuclear transport factor 2 family protein [Nevskia sp.]